MTRHRQDWEPDAATRPFLKAVQDVLNGPDLRDYWPVTLRGVHYAMLGISIGPGAVYENTNKHYKKLGGLLTLARLSGKIRWGAIADNHRKIMEHGGGWTSPESFIDYCRRDFLDGYHRDLLKTQPTCVELWVEKDTIARYVDDVASEYGLSTVIARGYGSISFVNDLRNRIEENTREGKNTRVLYFGDLDPSGVNMLKAMFTTLHEEMDVSEHDADYVRCAINPEHVKRFNLPPNPDALKDDAWQAKQRAQGLTDKTKGDPRAEAYKDEFGKVAVELDALGPRRLQTLVRKAIEDNLDMTLFHDEQQQEDEDRLKIEKVRDNVSEMLDDAMKPKPPKKPTKKPRGKNK